MMGKFNSDTLTCGTFSICDTLPLSAGWRDYLSYLTKFDSSGNPIWLKSYDKNININAIAIDTNERIFATGDLRNTVIWNRDTFNISDTADIFVAKLNGTGNLSWAKTYTGTSWQSGTSIAVDKYDGIWICGIFPNYYPSYSINFGGHVLTSDTTVGMDPLFLAQLDCSGNYLYGEILSGGSDDYCGIYLDNRGGMFLAGDIIDKNLILGADTVFAIPVIGGYSESPFNAKYRYMMTNCLTEGIGQVEDSIGHDLVDIGIYPNPACEYILKKLCICQK